MYYARGESLGHLSALTCSEADSLIAWERMGGAARTAGCATYRSLNATAISAGTLSGVPFEVLYQGALSEPPSDADAGAGLKNGWGMP